MGKFIDEKAIINNNIKNYNNYVNDKGKFIEGSPSFVTYYSKNIKASTEDIGLGNVVEIIGSESPIKFNRINDFPLYGFDEMQLQYDYDEELGLDNSIDGNAIILPGTIKPLVDDYFSISYLDKKLLFRITNIEGSSLGAKFFYKIEYSLSSSSVNILEERQIEERYDTIYDNIGTVQKSLIEESLTKYLNRIDLKIDELKKAYIKYFYNEKMNLFILHDEIYDNYLHEFINKNNIFITPKSFRENIIVQPVLYTDDRYYNSIFGVLEDNDAELINEMYNSLIFHPIPKDRHNVFKFQINEYKQTTWINQDDGLFSNLINGFNLKKSNENSVKIFLEYFNINHCHLEDKIQVILELLNNRIKNDVNNYILVPCYIYILLKLKNNILNK